MPISQMKKLRVRGVDSPEVLGLGSGGEVPGMRTWSQPRVPKCHQSFLGGVVGGVMSLLPSLGRVTLPFPQPKEATRVLPCPESGLLGSVSMVSVLFGFKSVCVVGSPSYTSPTTVR